MGAKVPKMPPPPPVDTSVQDKMDASEAKLEAEKKKAIGLRKKGMGGTILTGGQGVEEEAATGKSVLSSY
jgi:hypothetical protein